MTIKGIACRVLCGEHSTGERLKRLHRTAFQTLPQVKSPQGRARWPRTSPCSRQTANASGTPSSGPEHSGPAGSLPPPSGSRKKACKTTCTRVNIANTRVVLAKSLHTVTYRTIPALPTCNGGVPVVCILIASEAAGLVIRYVRATEEVASSLRGVEARLEGSRVRKRTGTRMVAVYPKTYRKSQ